jgi:type I restriction enzyme S subunit
LPKKEFIELTLLRPPLSEQKKIADVLSKADEAIEKVDEAIEKTQRLKKGLMQQLLTHGIGHKEFRETKIGRIPKEWNVDYLGNIAMLDRGKFAHRPRNDPRFYGGRYPFIQTGDISEAKGIVKKYSQTLNEEGIKISRLFKKGTLVITIAGNIGDIGILNFDSYFPDSIVGISPAKTKINSFFLLYMMTKLKSEISSMAPRSTQKNINLEILKKIKLPLPPLFEQKKIADILSVSDKKIELLTNRKTKLKRIKKGLMNDLLTGEKRVKLDS